MCEQGNIASILLCLLRVAIVHPRMYYLTWYIFYNAWKERPRRVNWKVLLLRRLERTSACYFSMPDSRPARNKFWWNMPIGGVNFTLKIKIRSIFNNALRCFFYVGKKWMSSHTPQFIYILRQKYVMCIRIYIFLYINWQIKIYFTKMT